MARRIFVHDLVDKVHMGDIYRMQLADLNKKVDELLEADRDDIAEMYKADLMDVREKIKESEVAKEKIKQIIERAKLTPLEYLLFDLRFMKKMSLDDIATKIAENPLLQTYVNKKAYYSNILKEATTKIKAAGE